MEGMKIDEQVFRSHLEMGPFQVGVNRGKWRLIDITWPVAIVAVRAAERDSCPDEFFIRFELSNYPQSPPVGEVWDLERNAKLERSKRPCGPGRVSKAFRDDRSSLYLPCDRLEIESHPEWRAAHPSMLWSPDGDITQYLRIIYDLLNSQDYSGIGSA